MIRLVSDIVHIDTMQIPYIPRYHRWPRRSRDRVLVLPCRENEKKKKKKKKKKGGGGGKKKEKGKEPVEGVILLDTRLYGESD